MTWVAEALSSAYSEFVARAYRLPAEISGETVSALEARFKDARVFVQRIRRVDRVFEPRPDERLEGGDIGFLAVTGMTAGPDFVKGLQQSGLVLVAACFIVTIVPHLVTLLVGRYVLKVHPGVLLAFWGTVIVLLMAR